MPTESQKTAVIYTRISRDHTGERAGVKRQEQMCRQLAKSRGWKVVAVKTDNSVSAYSGREREAFEQVMSMAERGEMDYIVAYAVDRLTRSLADWVRIDSLSRDHGVALVTVTGDADLSNPNGRTVAGMMALMARQESERKADRQRAANEQRARAGRPWSSGVRPFGYTQDRSETIPAEATAIRDAARRALAGVPLAQIARDWSAAGLPNGRKRATGWTARGVKSVLTNPVYARRRVYRGEIFPNGGWPAILDDATHLALVQRLNDPARLRGANHRGRAPQNLLTGIATCGICGATLVASADIRRGKLLRYRCKTPAVHVFVPRPEIDACVEGWMISFLSLPENVVSLMGSESDSSKGLDDERRALRSRLEVVEANYADGQLDWSAYRRLASRIEANLAEVEDAMARAAGSHLVSGFLTLGQPDKVREKWESLPLASRRTLVAQTVTVSVARAGRGASAYDTKVGVTIKRRKAAGGASRAKPSPAALEAPSPQ